MLGATGSVINMYYARSAMKLTKVLAGCLLLVFICSCAHKSAKKQNWSFDNEVRYYEQFLSENNFIFHDTLVLYSQYDEYLKKVQFVESLISQSERWILMNEISQDGSSYKIILLAKKDNEVWSTLELFSNCSIGQEVDLPPGKSREAEGLWGQLIKKEKISSSLKLSENSLVFLTAGGSEKISRLAVLNPNFQQSVSSFDNIEIDLAVSAEYFEISELVLLLLTL